jgi:hypothetical protein
MVFRPLSSNPEHVPITLHNAVGKPQKTPI